MEASSGGAGKNACLADRNVCPTNCLAGGGNGTLPGRAGSAAAAGARAAASPRTGGDQAMNPFPPDDIQPLTISALTRDIKTMLEVNYPQGVWVTGEVSNLSRPSSGHVYLKLKDAESQLNAVVYRGVALRLRFDLQDGMEVIAKGRLIVYVPRGEYQLQVEEIQPKGIGPLELAFRQLKEKLSIRGYFDPRRKKPLPRFPRRIVLVTSASGAAVRDMLEVLQRRWPAVEVWVCPV